MAKKQTLQQIETSLSRWKTRLRRAVTMIDKLERQQKRLQKAQAQAQAAAKPPSGPLLHAAAPAPTAAAPVPDLAVAHPLAKAVVKDVDTSIPAFLRRSPDPAAEAIRAEQAETKRLKALGRVAKLKAKKAGELKKMPLTGKAALAAIRG